jgi:CheY-like chemotaxis protein
MVLAIIFAARLRAARFPLVLLSGNSGLEQIALENGAGAFLEKPFEILELIALTNRFCGILQYINITSHFKINRFLNPAFLYF